MMESGNSTGSNHFFNGEILQELVHYLPPYLLQNREAALGFQKELKNFPDKINYYSQYHQGEWLQGDGFQDFEVYSFEKAESKKTKGIIISNSCDISKDNERELPVNITFAPVVPLEGIEKIIIRVVGEEKAKSKINSIKSQKVTNMFFLPAQTSSLEEDYVVMFDQMAHMPRKYCETHVGKQLFTLSQSAFYLFTMKLSMHFCRLHENILRDIP